MQINLGQAIEQVARACRGYLCNADERILLDQCFKIMVDFTQKGAKAEAEAKKKAEAALKAAPAPEAQP